MVAKRGSWVFSGGTTSAERDGGRDAQRDGMRSDANGRENPTQKKGPTVSGARLGVFHMVGWGANRAGSHCLAMTLADWLRMSHVRSGEWNSDLEPPLFLPKTTPLAEVWTAA